MVRYFLVGEIHGTQECPKIFWDIVKRNNIKKIALEFPIEEQCEVNNFMQYECSVDALSIFKRSEDKRASKAIRSLLLKARRAKYHVYFVDPNTLNNRDQEMANNLVRLSGKIAFLCGNIHASKVKVEVDLFVRFFFSLIVWLKTLKWYIQKKEFLTCGSFLPKSEVISFEIQTEKALSQKEKKLLTDLRKAKNKHPLLIPSKNKGFDFKCVVSNFTRVN